MKTKSTFLISTVALLFTTTVFAEQETEQACVSCLDNNIYLKLEAGASFSTHTDMDVLTGENQTTDWDIAAQGYNSNLGTSEVLGASIGYLVNPLVAFELELANRNSFNYKKDQSSPPPDGDKTRYFDVKNTTVMANIFLNGSGLQGPYSYKNDYFMIEPFVNAGMGAAFNTVDNFHSVQSGTGIHFSSMNNKTKTSFAYQLGAGVNLRTDNLGIALGYRYVDAGQFESNDVIKPSELSPDSVELSPWKGYLRMNEVYLALSYYFA